VSCPTCDHTMERIDLAAEGESRLFLCPRCGTVKFEHPHGEPTVYVPKLVERCREFEERRYLVSAGDFRPWFTLGIAESINLPGKRPGEESR
jgi:hypothetical protein